MEVKVVILAWWSWTRLWPLSRKYYPKQFLQLKELQGKSLFEQTFERALKLTNIENIYVITNKDYKFHCMNQANIEEKNIILEPEWKNTMWAISLWFDYFSKEDVALILPSDHIIKDEDVFIETVQKSIKHTNQSIITFWIKPTQAHTGYGYISTKTQNQDISDVVEFKEKPDKQTAVKYIENGYYWNAGIFLLKKEVFTNELQQNNKEYYNIIKNWVLKNFDKLPDVSIDYWLLEKTNNIKMSKLDIYWNDLWSFDSIQEYLEDINYKNENTINIDGKDNFIMCEKKDKLITNVWVSNLIVVDTDDALLIANKWDSQKVKELVKTLKKDKKNILNYSNTVYRPWWKYTIIDEWTGFKTKRLTVLPWKKLSSQLHYHRSEHWVIVSGTAKITLDDKEIILSKWESTYIPIWSKHRVENCWKVDLHIIESQIWDYLEEDDIVRFDDVFWRK